MTSHRLTWCLVLILSGCANPNPRCLPAVKIVERVPETVDGTVGMVDYLEHVLLNCEYRY